MGKYEDYVKPRLFEIKMWSREGLTYQEIAKRLGIAVITLKAYRETQKELKNALIEGRQVADYKVEDALYKKALGYKVNEEVKERVFNKDTREYEIITTKVISKEVPPDMQAVAFWLKNRKSATWREKQDLNFNGQLDLNNKFEYLTNEELEEQLKKLGEQIHE